MSEQLLGTTELDTVSQPPAVVRLITTSRAIRHCIADGEIGTPPAPALPPPSCLTLTRGAQPTHMHWLSGTTNTWAIIEYYYYDSDTMLHTLSSDL